MKGGHCDHVFCPECPYAHFCDRACGLCPDGQGGLRPAFWEKEALEIEDLSEVKDLMIDTGVEIEEAEDDDDDFDDDDEVFVEESEEAIEEKEEEFLEEYAEDHPKWHAPTENP
jgi:hypothetical protein